MIAETWRSVLERYPAPCRPIGPVESLGNAGGFSGSKLWRFQSGLGRVALRAWPIDGPNAIRLARIHAWIAEAGSLPFLPVPVVASDGRTFQECEGRLWDLSPWMPGVADPARPPSSPRVRAAFSGLATFHTRFTPRRRLPSPGIQERMRDVERWIGGDLVAVRTWLFRAGFDPRSDLTRLWLDRATRMAPGLRDLLRGGASAVPIQPCLRDARADHFLFDGDRLAGLVDFGAMALETVAGDLARLLGEMVPARCSARYAAMEAYRSVRPLADEEERLIPLFESANAILGAGRWIRWHFLEGRTFDDPDAVANGIRRCLPRMDEIAGYNQHFRS